MRRFFFPIFLSLLCASAAHAEPAIRKNVQRGKDHEVQASSPRGRLLGPMEFHARVFPGTVRRYWVFVPAQYQPSKPASLLVFQDGQRATNPEGSTRIQTVLDNLIAQGDIPVTIGLFVTPGNRSKRYPNNLGMSNPDHRAQEYDAMDDRYARLLIDEMIPELEKKYNLTKDPEQRAIGGTSSGAIAAFTVAWHRPDYFRKVYSGIGSYVSIGFRPNEKPPKLGGQDYPALIRRERARPLRIFLQDGSNDLDNEWGNWFLANQQMVRAMTYANRVADERERGKARGPRYELEVVWTDGEHSDSHPGALLPEGLRWLWADGKK